MAINKKLIHFNKKSDFESEVAKGNILNYSICFIADTKEIYTHGNYYSQVSEAPIDGQKYIRVDGAWYVLSTSSSSTDGLMSSSDKTKLDGIESGAQKNTVTGIKVGSTQYDPDSDCIISLPEFPTATTIEWDNILNKPSSFTPSAHTHAISEITNLQSTLDGKAAASHTHAIADITNISSASVSYASSAGNADTLDGNHASAFAAASHTHSYIPTSASCNKNWAWSGQGGQPSWLWGSNDGSNCYVWNPSNFRVNYASSAGNADTLDGNHASAFATAGHTHSYLPLSGGTMTGAIITPGNDSVVIKPARNNYDQIGGEGQVFFKIWANYFNGTLNGSCTGNAGYASSAGNADTVDGYHASSFAAASHSHSYLPLSGGTMTGRISTNMANSEHIELRSNSTGYSCSISMGYTNGKAWSIGCRANGDYGVWFYNSIRNIDSHIFYPNGSLTISGSLSQSSDMRLKNVLSDMQLDVNSIAQAPLFQFTYIYDSGNRHVGTSAQYWDAVYKGYFTKL